MHMTTRAGRTGSVVAVTLLALAIQVCLAQAQAEAGSADGAQEARTTTGTGVADPPATDETKTLDNVVVVGSRIRGSRVSDALPVARIGREQIDATGAVSGDDLFRSIPQMGDVSFNQSKTPATSNAARGDVNSINLRSLGVGNTLVLLNGRRLVQHPTSQADEQNVPVLTYNANAIPVAGVEQMEILLDGAAAIYGADAVAGVVNTVLKSDFDGIRVDVQYGGAQSTRLDDLTANVFAGKNFSRGNISLFASLTDRSAQLASDQDYTATHDLRFLFANDPNFSSSLLPDRRTVQTPWAILSTPAAYGVIRQGSTALTTAAGAFHIRPGTLPGCATDIGGGVCIGSGGNAFTGATRDMRYDTAVGTTVSPNIRRGNFFLLGNYDFNNGVTAFGELGYYSAKSDMIQAPALHLGSMTVPASNYWNPFGPIAFADGTANPNRLPGLSNVPDEGLPITLSNYRFVDTGLQRIEVENRQSRFLGGLRGQWSGFDWETALLYSEAQAVDLSGAIDRIRLQKQMALSTPDAYNPFSGGCVDTPSYGDCSPSSKAAVDAVYFQLERKSRATLALVDLKFSRSDLFDLPGGPLGMAMGLEARRETQLDDRDPNIDGTIEFIDSVTGQVNASNVTAVSPTPDTRGDRNVGSVFVEFAVPLVSPEMEVPLIRSLDLQVAGRYEHYSDFGNATKPKLAAAWGVFDGFKLRGSYSEGFRAPNLEQINATQYSRAGSNNDYVRCEAELRAGRITDFTACSFTGSYSNVISGNPDLKPEESKNYTAGFIFRPVFIPERFGDFSLTMDWWRIRQSGVVGQFGQQNALVLDYLLRTQGSSNPRVVRATPTTSDVAQFAGTGLAPAGRVLEIYDEFVNLLPQEVEGLDIALAWWLVGTRWGDFSVNLNAAHLDKFEREISDTEQDLYDARNAGEINAATPLGTARDLLRRDGRPEWRYAGSLTWDIGAVQVGAFAQYIGSVVDSGFLGLDGEPYRLDSTLTGNLYVQYTFGDFGWGRGARVRLGARNITDEQPPLTSGSVNSGAYMGSLYNPYGRYLYVNISTTF